MFSLKGVKIMFFCLLERHLFFALEFWASKAVDPFFRERCNGVSEITEFTL